MDTQENIFLKSEGNMWYKRNQKTISHDHILDWIKNTELHPKNILEVGSSSGNRLHELYKLYNSQCFGIDPSEEAIKHGKEKYPEISFTQGTADNLPYENNYFDLIIMGFCLCLCSRNELFKISYEIDRILKNRGKLIVLDFHTFLPYKNKWVHCEDVWAYKYDYSKMFTWNPAYQTIFQKKFSHDNKKLNISDQDNICSISVIEKMEDCWVNNPFIND